MNSQDWNNYKKTHIRFSDITINDVIKYSTSTWFGKVWLSISKFEQIKGVSNKNIQDALNKLDFPAVSEIHTKAKDVLKNESNDDDIRLEASILEKLTAEKKNDIMLHHFDAIVPLTRFDVIKEIPEGILYLKEHADEAGEIEFLEDLRNKIIHHQVSQNEFNTFILNVLEKVPHADAKRKKEIFHSLKNLNYLSTMSLLNPQVEDKITQILDKMAENGKDRIKLAKTSEIQTFTGQTKLPKKQNLYSSRSNIPSLLKKDPLEALDRAAATLDFTKLVFERDFLLDIQEKKMKKSTKQRQAQLDAVKKAVDMKVESSKKKESDVVEIMISEIEDCWDRCYSHYPLKSESPVDDLKEKIYAIESDCRLVQEIARSVLDETGVSDAKQKIINRLKETDPKKMNYPNETIAYANELCTLMFGS
jgi:hypothetical protein